MVKKLQFLWPVNQMKVSFSIMLLLTRQFYWWYFVHDWKLPIKNSDGKHFMWPTREIMLVRKVKAISPYGSNPFFSIFLLLFYTCSTLFKHKSNLISVMKIRFNFITIEATELQEVQFKILCILKPQHLKGQAFHEINCKVLQCCNEQKWACRICHIFRLFTSA